MDMAKVRMPWFSFSQKLWNAGLDPSVSELEYFPPWFRIRHEGRNLHFQPFQPLQKEPTKMTQWWEKFSSPQLHSIVRHLVKQHRWCQHQRANKVCFSYMRFDQEIFYLSHETFSGVTKHLICKKVKLRLQKWWVHEKGEGREQCKGWGISWALNAWNVQWAIGLCSTRLWIRAITTTDYGLALFIVFLPGNFYQIFSPNQYIAMERFVTSILPYLTKPWGHTP